LVSTGRIEGEFDGSVLYQVWLNQHIKLSKRFQKWLEKMIKPNLEQRFESAQIAQKALKSNDGSFSNYSERQSLPETFPGRAWE
jgi:hypothetical protein